MIPVLGYAAVHQARGSNEQVEAVAGLSHAGAITGAERTTAGGLLGQR